MVNYGDISPGVREDKVEQVEDEEKYHQTEMLVDSSRIAHGLVHRGIIQTQSMEVIDEDDGCHQLENPRRNMKR